MITKINTTLGPKVNCWNLQIIPRRSENRTAKSVQEVNCFMIGINLARS